MKNIFIYYLAILLPMLFLVWLALNNNAIVFSILLMFYVLFRCFIDGVRLMNKNVISKREYWKTISNPSYPIKYFKQLYLEK